MAATRGPARSLPMCSQFLRLWKAFHNRNYEQSGIMQSSTGSDRDFGRWALGTVESATAPVFCIIRDCPGTLVDQVGV
jgi:hypothetical protein